MIRGKGSPAVEVGRSYAPILAAALAFLVMAGVVDPADRHQDALAATGGSVTGPGATVASGSVAVDPATGATVPAGAVDPATGAPVAAAPGGQAPTAPPTGCPDRALQVPGDPYSPPCVAFSGDNGGATYRGVTADEILVSVRELEGPTAAEIFADLSGQPVLSSREAYRATLEALVEYFNTRFQFYGRKIRLQFYGGQGNGSSELLGAGQERALADAVRVSEEIQAFADVSGITTPYANALSRQGVVNIGAPYPPIEWYLDRRPFAWSMFPDGTKVVDTMAQWLNARMRPEPIVQFAGDSSMNGKQRVYGVVGPENPEYQSSGDRFGSQIQGLNIATSAQYRIDIASMPNQASNIIAQLKDAGVTTVVCFCDPVMLALGMAPKANEQGYHPEWITAGLAFVEQDIVGQLIDPEQWAHAFGTAFNAESEPMTRSFPRSAYRAMRPGSEPAFGIEEMYYQLYVLAIGLQGAGPNLTPETFEQGMFAYPGASGPRGFWKFGPDDYTTVDDFREIWWDAERISPQNARPGAWVQMNEGRRWNLANLPTGPTTWFQG